MKKSIDNVGFLMNPSVLWALVPDETGGMLSGQPTLDKGSLLGKGDALLQWFSDTWRLIGWQLERPWNSENAEDLRRVRNALEPPRTDRQVYRLGIFLRPTVSPLTAQKFRETRRSVVKRAKRGDEARSDFMPLEDACCEAEAALCRTGPRDRAAVEAELDRRWVNLEATTADLYDANRELESLRARLEDHQAYLAQTQLFRFLRDRRYELNPLNLASAMAGLHEISYSVSLGLCAKACPEGLPYTMYRVFKLID